MTKQALEITSAFGRDSLAEYIGHTWETYNGQRKSKLEQWKELRNYLFATDTTTTTNKSLPWKNSTTLPKLCQIRDNLHSNYLSAIFPNDSWLKWDAADLGSANIKKVRAIEAYMGNKTREGGFRNAISAALYDFIDYGNAFGTVVYENRAVELQNGEKTPYYIGPKPVRISPLDIVFNPLASSFADSFKIVRSLKHISTLQAMLEDEPGNEHLISALAKRKTMLDTLGRTGYEDLDKAEALSVDGFGSYSEYLQSGYVEYLDFYGDYFNQATGELERDKIVTVIDRMFVIRNIKFPSWLGGDLIYHVGWRTRPDNLWAMGPLDNLVGMQYRIDHLENLKADAMDLAVLPPLVIKGEVEEFTYGPGVEIHVDSEGGVAELAKNVQWVIQADNSIDRLEARMEQYAGAPKEAMGIRTAGEKTAFEVQQLQNAAGRIFQEKVTHFEINYMEKILNAMLEISRRNLNVVDVARVIDNDLGVATYMEITKEDITASGKLRPIGARHFAAQAQLLQNIQGVFNSQIGQIVSPHLSAIKLATLVEDAMGLGRFQLFAPNAAVYEQQETQRQVNQAQEDLQVEQSTPMDAIQ